MGRTKQVSKLIVLFVSSWNSYFYTIFILGSRCSYNMKNSYYLYISIYFNRDTYKSFLFLHFWPLHRLNRKGGKIGSTLESLAYGSTLAGGWMGLWSRASWMTFGGGSHTYRLTLFYAVFLPTMLLSCFCETPCTKVQLSVLLRNHSVLLILEQIVNPVV